MASGPVRPPDRGTYTAPAPYIPPPDKQFGTIPPPPAPSPFPGYMSPQELAALAAKTIADAYAPQLAYMQQQQQRARQMSGAQQAGLAELYKIISGQAGSVGGNLTKIYSDAASGLGNNLPSDLVTGDVPVSQQIVGSGGLAGPGYGDAYPRLAGQQGQVEFLKAVQEGNATQADYTDQIAKLMAEEPGKIQQVLSDLNSQQGDLAKQAQGSGPIIRSVGGNLVAVDPNTGKVQVLYKGDGTGKAAGYDAALSAQVGYLVDKNRQPILDSKGKTIPYTPTGTSGQTRLTFQTVKGRRVGIDPYTGEIKVDYGPAGTKGTKPSNLQVKTIPVDGVNHQVAIDPRTGKVVVDYGPTKKTGDTGTSKGIIDPATGKPLTTSGYKGYANDTIATIDDMLSKKRYDQATKTWIKHVPASINAIMDVLRHTPIPQGVWRSVLAKKFGIPSWAVKGVTSESQTSQLRYMPFARLRSIAAFLGYQAPPAPPGAKPGTYGLDKNGLIQWIQGHVPKADAAATGGTTTSYSGVPRQQASLAQKYGTKYGVDPRVLLAIAGHETHWGTLGAGRQGYTLGYGATDSGQISRYAGVENQYRWAAQTLAKWGVHTIEDILAGLAASYATDPNWEQGVARVYQSLGGGTV